MTWTRRRCPECDQLVVAEELAEVTCPSCGAQVGQQSTIPEPVEEEPEREAPVEGGAPSTSPPEMEEVAQEWNLGEPMHRVFWFCLVAPDRVALATMFRSLRWVFVFAWLGQVLIQLSGLGMGAAMLRASESEIAALRDFAAATEEQQAGGPEAQRLREAEQNLCTITMLSPAQRLVCAFNPALQPVADVGLRAKRRIDAVDRLQRPDRPAAWLESLFTGLLFLLIGLIPLWGMLGLARQPQAWSLALKASAFGQVPVVAGAVIAAPVMLLGGHIGVSLGVMLLICMMLWSLVLVAGFLIRLGSMMPRQALMIVLVVVLFDLMIITRLATAI